MRTMLHEVPTLAQKYASVEEKLFTKLVKKYGTEDSLCEKETIPTWNSLLCALEACPRIALPEAVRSVCSGATCSGLTVANIQSERFFHLALALVDASVEDDADARGALQMIFREDFIPASFVKRLIAQCDEGLRVASRVTVCCDRDSASAASAMSWIRLSQILLSTLPSSSIPRRMLRSLFLLCHCDGGAVARSSWFEVAALARRSWISMRVSKLNEGSTDGETFVASDECTLLNVVSASDGINISRDITSWLASVIMPKDPIDNGETTHLNFAVWAAQCLGSWALFSQHATATAKSDDSWWEAVVVGSQSMWSRAKSNRVLWNRLIFAFGALVDCTGSIETIMKEIASSKDSITTSPFVWLPVEIAYAAACGYMHRRTSIARSIMLYLNFASAPHFGAALQCAQDVQEIVSPNSSAVDVARRCLNVHLRPLLNSSAVITKPAAMKSACDALNSSWVGNVVLHTADSLCDALERKSDSPSLWAESEARKVALHIIVGCVVDVDVLIPAFDAPIIRPAADRLLAAPDDSKISPSVDSNQIVSKSTKTNESEVESQEAKSETLRKSSDAFVKGGKAIYTNEARGLVGVEIEIVRVHHDASGLSFYEILLPDGKIIGTIASKLQSKQVCAPSCRPDYRETLLQFYREHVPRKLDDVDMLLQKYHGNESTLIAAIETKYGRSVRLVMVDAASPTTPGTRSSGSDSEDEDANLKRALEMSVEPVLVSVVDKKEKSGVVERASRRRGRRRQRVRANSFSQDPRRDATRAVRAIFGSQGAVGLHRLDARRTHTILSAVHYVLADERIRLCSEVDAPETGETHIAKCAQALERVISGDPLSAQEKEALLRIRNVARMLCLERASDIVEETSSSSSHVDHLLRLLLSSLQKRRDYLIHYLSDGVAMRIISLLFPFVRDQSLSAELSNFMWRALLRSCDVISSASSTVESSVDWTTPQNESKVDDIRSAGLGSSFEALQTIETLVQFATKHISGRTIHSDILSNNRCDRFARLLRFPIARVQRLTFMLLLRGIDAMRDLDESASGDEAANGSAKTICRHELEASASKQDTEYEQHASELIPVGIRSLLSSTWIHRIASTMRDDFVGVAAATYEWYACVLTWCVVLRVLNNTIASKERNALASCVSRSKFLGPFLELCLKRLVDRPSKSSFDEVYDEDDEVSWNSTWKVRFPFPDTRASANALHRSVICETATQLPALMRKWWDARTSSVSREDRALRVAFERYIVKNVCQRCIKSELQFISRAAKLNMWDTDVMTVRGNSVSRTITASYKTDESTLEIHLELPPNYPLVLPRIDCSRRFGVEEDRRRRWMIQIRSLISSENGSILGALMLWKENLDQEFSGVDPCPICFSVIHVSQRTLPRLRCGTCKARFHSHCLYKWFGSSQKSACPMCRQPF